MKTNGSNKDFNYSLHIIENYKKDFDSPIEEITNKYSMLIIDYYKFIIENIKIKNQNYSKFIIIRGLDTITHVFKNLIFYTKNIDLTYFHCQKSFYFYVEFVGQISEDEKIFLQLSSRDASTYVYKKTIFEINNDVKKNESFTNNIQFLKTIDIINCYINIYNLCLQKIIQHEILNINLNAIDSFEKISYKLNYSLIEKNNIQKLDKLIYALYDNIENIHLFFDILKCIIKKFLKNNDIIKNYQDKFSSEIFLLKLEEPTDKFVTWLLL